MQASGILGVNQGDPLTALHVDLTVRDLQEYNQLLTSMGLEGNGKREARRSLCNFMELCSFQELHRCRARPRRKGHLQATNIDFAMGSTDALIDSLLPTQNILPMRESL